MRRMIRITYQPKIFLAVILLFAFSVPLGGRSAAAASPSPSPGFVIHADRIEGEMMVPGVTIGPDGKPVLVFKYASATIHGLKLTNVVQSPDGPNTIVITANLVQAKNMTVRATGFSAGGACLQLGKTYPQAALKDVTLLAHHMEASQMDLQGLHVSVVSGAHGQERPSTSRVIKDLAGLPANALEDAIDDLLSGQVPLTCDKEGTVSDKNNEGNNGTGIAGKTEDITDLFENATDEAEGITGNAGDLLDGAKDTVEGADEVLDDAGNLADDTIDDVNDILDGATDGEGHPVNEAAHNIGDTVNDVLDDVGGAAGDLTDNAGDAVGGPVGDVVKKSGDTVENVVDEAGDTVEDAAGDAGETVNDLASGKTGEVDEDVGQTVTDAANHVEQVSQEILDGVSDIGNQASGMLSDPKKTLKSLNLGELDEIGRDVQNAAGNLSGLETGLLGLLSPNKAEQSLKELNGLLGGLKKKQRGLENLRKAVQEKQGKLNHLENKLAKLKSQATTSSEELKKRLQDARNNIEKASAELNSIDDKITSAQKEIKGIASDAKEKLNQNSGLLGGLTGTLGNLFNKVTGRLDDLLS
ncbi:MAG TPA: hypothetical protein VF149_02195 [Bacillales bacterium]